MAAELILIVEDSDDDEKLARLAIRRALGNEVSVAVAADGEGAIHHLMAREDNPPKLVLLDLKMPKVGGLDVLRQVRKIERLREVPIIVLSSSDEPSDIEQAMSLGATDYVQKPVDFETYLRVIQAAVKRWCTAT